LYFCPFVLAPLHSNRHYLPWWDDDAYMGGQLLAEPSVKIPSSRGLSQRASDFDRRLKIVPRKFEGQEPSTMEDHDNEWKPTVAPSLETTRASTKTKPKKEKNPSTKSKRDTAIQGLLKSFYTLISGTNDSSIVSKRSVERAGYDVKCSSHEWFRHFVKKPARRSPLINLGYFVRMKAIETVLDNVFTQRLLPSLIRQFLLAPSPRRKMVVNLGCGYDPLPFAYLANGASAMFVDVDYPDLIRHKQKIVEQTPAMMECVGTTWMTESSEAKGESYRLVGCDLTDLPSLDEKLRALQADLHNTDILFVSEVAITYMVHPPK